MIIFKLEQVKSHLANAKLLAMIGSEELRAPQN